MNSHISVLDTTHSDRKPLQFSSRELIDLTLHNDFQVEGIDNFLHVGQLQLAVQHLSNRLLSLDRTRNVIDVLRLDQRLDVVFENFGEVILKFGSSEVLQDIRPIRGNLRESKIESSIRDRRSSENEGRKETHIEFPEIGFQFSTQDLQRRTLSDTVGSD